MHAYYIRCHINCFHFQKTYFFLYVYHTEDFPKTIMNMFNQLNMQDSSFQDFISTLRQLHCNKWQHISPIITAF